MERAGLTRWATLDYLRGLMALSVLVFHFDKWTTGEWDATTLQGKLGVYAVSVFFILSGMALTVTYEHTLTASVRSLSVYAIKRVFRIFPLLWLVTTATLVLEDTPRSEAAIFLNFTGLFGFTDPSGDIATGAWSIGCELVFYAFFPVLLFLVRRKHWSVLPVAALLTAIAGRMAFSGPYFAGVTRQAEWWPYYVQVLQHAWFFVAGITLAVYREWLLTWPRAFWWLLLCASTLIFIRIPVGSDPLELVRGARRLELSFLAVLATAAYSFGFGNGAGVLQKILTWLGAVSYALYLLHPLVYRVVKALLVRCHLLSDGVLLAVAFGVTLVASHVLYHHFERPAMRFGASLAYRLASR